MKHNNRQIFTGRQTFGTANARLKVKRKTFDDGKDAIVTLAGYPILWGETSSDRGGYSVRLVKGSAQFTTPAVALYYHQFSAVIGNTANDTLRILPADEFGVPVEIDLPNTSMGRDVAELVDKGYVSGMSFSMVNGFEDYTESKEAGNLIVNATKFTVDEVTVCVNPAFTGTTIAVQDDPDDENGESDDDSSLASVDAPARVAASAARRKARLELLSL